MAETVSPGRRSSDAKVMIAPNSGGGVEASPSVDEALPHPSTGKRTTRAVDRLRIDRKATPRTADGMAPSKPAYIAERERACDACLDVVAAEQDGGRFAGSEVRSR